MRSIRAFFFFLAVSGISLTTVAQSAPQLVRDYVYGPGGRLAVTVEPDYYPPGQPSFCSAAMNGPCAIDGLKVEWGTATDIGSGVAGYYGPGGFTTGFSYIDYNITAEECYTYYVSAVDNAGHEGDSIASNTVCVDICIEEARNRLFLFYGMPRARSPFRHVRLPMTPEGASRPVSLKVRKVVVRRWLYDPPQLALPVPATKRNVSRFGEVSILPAGLISANVAGPKLTVRRSGAARPRFTAQVPIKLPTLLAEAGGEL